MIYIEVPDMNDSMSEISIDGVTYLLRFTYNERYKYWSFGIYTEEEEAIITMTKIVPGFDLFHYYSDADLPDGVFGCLCDKETVERNDFIDGTAEFVFIYNSEIAELLEEA